MKNLKKLDYLNLGAIVLAVIGVIVEIIGGAVFSVPIDIGFNLALSPVMFVGIGIMAVGLVLAIAGTALTEKCGLNKKLSTAALYLTTIALMFAFVYLVLVVVMPVLKPKNG